MLLNIRVIQNKVTILKGKGIDPIPYIASQMAYVIDQLSQSTPDSFSEHFKILDELKDLYNKVIYYGGFKYVKYFPT
jgi:hypothetical protein